MTARWLGLLVLVPLVPAAVLTTARLAGPDGEHALRLVSYTPYALPLYAVVLVAAVVTLLRTRAPVWWLALAVGLAGLGLHGWWFAPLVSGANPPPARDAEPLRVMTANLHGDEADGIAVAGVVAREEVDVLVLQEVSRRTLHDLDRSGLAELLPHRAGTPGPQGEGTMVLARSRVSQVRPLRLFWDGWRVEVAGLTLLGVHVLAPTEPGEWARDHRRLLEAAEESEADLVVGDLNATPDHAPLRRLADAGFRSAAELANQGFQPTWPPFGRESLLGLPLPHVVPVDHVLVGPSLAALGTHTVDLPGSDHRGLVAEVAVK